VEATTDVNDWDRRPAGLPGLLSGGPTMSRAQRILASIVGVITAVPLLESYDALVTAARAGSRAIPALWPLGTEAQALAMEASVLEAKRLGHRGAPRLSRVFLVASVALSTRCGSPSPHPRRLCHRRRRLWRRGITRQRRTRAARRPT
jgi:hypothetical protein